MKKNTKRAITLMIENLMADTECSKYIHCLGKPEFIDELKTLWEKLKLGQDEIEPDEDVFLNADFSCITDYYPWEDLKHVLDFEFSKQTDNEVLRQEIPTIFLLLYGKAINLLYHAICDRMTFGHFFTIRDLGEYDNYAGSLKMKEEDFVIYKALSFEEKIEYCKELDDWLAEKNLTLLSKNGGIYSRIPFNIPSENNDNNQERIDLDSIIDINGNVYVGLYDYWQ